MKNLFAIGDYFGFLEFHYVLVDTMANHQFGSKPTKQFLTSIFGEANASI
jgi:hypothetical protein